MRSWTIAFSVGVIVCGFVPQIPGYSLILLLGCASLVLSCWSRLRLVLAFLLGCCCLLLQARLSLDTRWPQALANADVVAEGIVANLPQPTERGQRVVFVIDRLCVMEQTVCTPAQPPTSGLTTLVNIYEPLALVPGQRWQWQLRLRPPRGFANPGGFDYEAWLLQQGIDASGYLRPHPGNRLLQHDSGASRFNWLRYAIATRVDAAAGGTLQYPHLIRALAIGDHYGISDSEWQLFRDTGTSHLIVISGTHVALIALVLYQLAHWGVSRCAWLVLRMPAPQIAAAVALAGAWVYAGLAGFSLPVQRALVMAAVLLAGRLLRRQTSSLNALCLALALILLLDPLAPQNAGFWLSYCAVAILLLTATPANPASTQSYSTRHWLRWLGQEWRTQWGVFIGLVPLLLLFFQQLSPLAPIVNMPAIPWIGLLVVPLCLIGTALLWLWPVAAVVPLRTADFLLDIFMQLLAASVREAPVALLQLPALPVPLLLLLVFLTVAALLAPRRWQRLTALATLPLVLLWPGQKLPEGRVRVAVLDVGQGLAVVVSTRNHHLLYDTGPWFSPRFDAGSDVVVPYLRHRNIRRLDRVVVSHADADHAGGLPGVVAAWPEAHYSGSEAAAFPAQAKAVRCETGQAWHWDGVEFELLHPDAGRYNRNNGSCVLRIRIGQQVVLLPGDIERKVEHQLLQAGLQGPVTLLVAPHHGSATSSSPAFVAALRPQLVVHASGYQNRFNHPAATVQARYARYGSRQYQTTSGGAITFDLSPAGLESIEQWRELRRRFWSAGGM
jgi:competence protein ComEC